MDTGKNCPHSPVFFIYSMMRDLVISYSFFVYCLFKIQYSLLRKPAQPNKFPELAIESQ